MTRSLRLIATAAALACSSAALHAQSPAGRPAANPGSGTPNAGIPGTTPGAGLPVVGPGQDTTASTRAMRGGRGGRIDSSLVAQLDTVNSAAKAGLTNLPPAAAAALVGSIQSKLAGSRSPALRSIAADLSALQTELSAGTVNGPRIGAILGRIGPKVSRVAGMQSGPVATTLNEIGSELTAASRQLAGG